HLERSAAQLLAGADHVERRECLGTAQLDRRILRLRVLDGNRREPGHVAEGDPADRVLPAPEDPCLPALHVEAQRRTEPYLHVERGSENRVVESTLREVPLHGAVGGRERTIHFEMVRKGDVDEPARAGSHGRVHETSLAVLFDPLNRIVWLAGECGGGGGDHRRHSPARRIEGSPVLQVAPDERRSGLLELLDLRRVRGGAHQGADLLPRGGEPTADLPPPRDRSLRRRRSCRVEYGPGRIARNSSQSGRNSSAKDTRSGSDEPVGDPPTRPCATP